MTKLLVLGRTQKPIPNDANSKQEELSGKLGKFGEVYSLAGLEGFAALLEMENLEALDSIIYESEFSKIGRIEILPLSKKK
jgi:hypothetical protein